MLVLMLTRGRFHGEMSTLMVGLVLATGLRRYSENREIANVRDLNEGFL